MRALVPAVVAAAAREGTSATSTPAATLVFDAEGSTALAARLRRHGDRGSEVLAGVLTSVFAPIVEEVHRYDGFVAHFTGDGVIAVFSGSGRAAVDAAIEAARSIMARLERVSRHRTPVGAIELRLRAIIGAGQIDQHLWRIDERPNGQDAAFAFVGSSLAEAQRGEALVDAGTIAIGPTAFGLLAGRPDTDRQLGEGFVALDHDGTVVTTHDAPRSAVPSTPGWHFVPDIVARGEVRGEFRDVICLFLTSRDLADERSGRPIVEGILDLAGRHAGFVSNVLRPGPDDTGVTALLVWGAPRSHERDLRRALRFGRDAVAELGSVRVGLCRDIAYAGFVGGEIQSTFTVVGSAVNLAARLVTAAGWGEIVTDDSIATDLPANWRADAIGTHGFKGFDTPTTTWRVVERASGAPRVLPAIPTGRHAEASRLVAALRRLGDDISPGFVVVAGAAGQGKTFLVQHARTALQLEVPDSTWIDVEVDEAYSRPFGVVTDAVLSLVGAGRLSQLPTRLEHFLGEVVVEASATPQTANADHLRIISLIDLLIDDAVDEPNTPPEARFDQIVLGVELLLGTALRRGAVVLGISGAEHMDRASAEVLRRLRRTFSTSAFAIVLETRDRPPSDADVEVILESLTRESVHELVQLAVGGKPSDEFTDLIHSRTGGNPYFASELVHLLVQQGAVRSGPDGLVAVEIDEHLPTNLRRLLLSRIDGLTVRTREMLLAASVLGTEVDPRFLVPLLDDASDIADHLAEARAAGLVAIGPDDKVTFAHALLRDAAYSVQLHADREHLHRKAADTIERVAISPSSHAEAIAHHHDRGGQRARATMWYSVAADRAARRYANQDALAFLARAIELADSPADEFDLRRRQLPVIERLGDRDAQSEAIAAMKGLASEVDNGAAEVSALEGRLLEQQGRFAPAGTRVRHALALLSADDRDLELRSRCYQQLADIERRLGHPGEAEHLALEAAKGFGAARHAGERVAIANLLGGLAWDAGDFEGAIAHHQRAVDIARAAGVEHDEALSLNNLGTALFGDGDYARARAIHEVGARRCAEIGYRMAEANHLDNLGGTWWAVGRYETAIEHYGDALRLRREIGDASGAAISLGNTGSARRLLGQVDTAIALYEEALAIDREVARPRGEGFDLHGLGLALTDAGRHREALVAFDEAIRVRASIGEHHLANESRMSRAAVLSALGRREEATVEVVAMLTDEPRPPFTRCVEPGAAMLIAVELLRVQHPDLADRVVEDAVRWLDETSRHISEPSLRRSYLDNVRAHRELLALGHPKVGPER